jgi:putative DNA primase/helicase
MLDPSQAVQAATAAYLDAEDAIAAWIDECGERDPSAWESSANLFTSWKAWAEKAGEYVGSQKRLTQCLENHGLSPHRRPNGRGLLGLRLCPRYMSEEI